MEKRGSFTATCVALLMAAFIALTPTQGVRAGMMSAEEVKAGFIFNFMKFVDWPPEYLASSFNVCVLGNNPFGSVLDKLSGRIIRGRPVRVVSNVPLQQTRYCHVVFVSRSEAGQLTNALLRLRQAPILTISDIEGFAGKGGVIEFFTGSTGDIVFRVSQKSAQEVGLRVSSRLLSLSK